MYMQELQGFSLNKCYNVILKQTNSREEHSLVIYRTVKIPPKSYYSPKGHVQASKLTFTHATIQWMSSSICHTNKFQWPHPYAPLHNHKTLTSVRCITLWCLLPGCPTCCEMLKMDETVTAVVLVSNISVPKRTALWLNPSITVRSNTSGMVKTLQRLKGKEQGNSLVQEHKGLTSQTLQVAVKFFSCLTDQRLRTAPLALHHMLSWGVWHSQDRASRYILIVKAIRCTISQVYFDKELYMFQTDLLSIIRGLNTVYTAISICHDNYVDCLLARSGSILISLAGSQHN